MTGERRPRVFRAFMWGDNKITAPSVMVQVRELENLVGRVGGGGDTPRVSLPASHWMRAETDRASERERGGRESE
jgi:hypothetical protein